MLYPQGKRNHGIVTGRVKCVYPTKTLEKTTNKTKVRGLTIDAVEAGGEMDVNFFNENVHKLDGIVVGIYVHVFVRITGRGAMKGSAKFINLTGVDIEVSQDMSQ